MAGGALILRAFWHGTLLSLILDETGLEHVTSCIESRRREEGNALQGQTRFGNAAGARLALSTDTSGHVPGILPGVQWRAMVARQERQRWG